MEEKIECKTKKVSFTIHHKQLITHNNNLQVKNYKSHLGVNTSNQQSYLHTN